MLDMFPFTIILCPNVPDRTDRWNREQKLVSSHVESVVKLERKDVKSKDYIEIGIDAEDYYRIKNKSNNKSS